MQKLFDFLPRETVQSFFSQVPPRKLIQNRTVSKAWSGQVSKDAACSIIETTMRLAKELLSGEISELWQALNQMSMSDVYSCSTSTGNQTITGGRMSYLIKNTPSDQNAVTPFNCIDHLDSGGKAALASKFLNIPITDIKNALSGKESSREHYEEFENLGYDALDKNQLTTFKVSYEYDTTNSNRTIKEVSFEPVKKDGELHVDSTTIDRVTGFFKEHPVQIEPEKPSETLPEESQPEKVLEKVKNQVNSFIEKHF
jgi:hypothetical protein